MAGAMPSYHFRLLKWDGETVIGHFVSLDGDVEAEQHARRYLGSRGVARVEVWGDGKLVCEVKERRGKRRKDPETK